MAQENDQSHDIRLGRILVRIFPNQGKDRDIWFNVKAYRLYKDGDKWGRADGFGRDDLPILSKALDMAYAWIWGQQVQANPDEPAENGRNG